MLKRQNSKLNEKENSTDPAEAVRKKTLARQATAPLAKTQSATAAAAAPEKPLSMSSPSNKSEKTTAQRDSFHPFM